MKFTRITLQTGKLKEQYSFYTETLGFLCTDRSDSGFTVQAGSTEICFLAAVNDVSAPYHLAFNVPENSLLSARDFLLSRNVQPIKSGQQIIYPFESWNAEALYFMDAEDNILELIVRHNLSIHNPGARFTCDAITCVSEMGIVAESPAEFTTALMRVAGITIWKEDGDDFKAAGDENGLLVIVKKSRPWFPTKKAAEPKPIILESPDIHHSFQQGVYQITPPRNE